MSKKKKTTINQTQVQTPNNPAWVEQPMQSLMGRINDLSNLDPYSLVAGPNATQQQAFAAAQGLGGINGLDQARSTLTGITNAAAPQVEAQSLLTGLDNYMSPYLRNVVDTTLADYDASAGRTRAQQALQMAGSGAFGGSGSAITQALTEGELARGRASTSANLLNTGFNTAAGLSAQDAAQRQAAQMANAELMMSKFGLDAQTAQALAQMGAMEADNNRANIQAQLLAGDQQRAIEQARLAAPLELLRAQAGLTGSLPLSMFTGQTTNTNGTETTKSSNPLGAIGTALAVAAAPFTGGASLAMLPGMAGTAGTIGSIIGGATAAKNILR